MNLIIWTVVGAALGWLTSVVTTRTQPERLLNIVVGIVGALLGGWLLAPVFGTGPIDPDHFNFGKLAVAMLIAISLLAIVNVLHPADTH